MKNFSIFAFLFLPTLLFAQTGTFNLATGTCTSGSCTNTSWSNPVLTVNNGANITVIGSNGRIVVNGTANVTLSDVSIILGSGNSQPPLLLNSGANLTLTLAGNNILTAYQSRAAVEAPSGTTLTIDGTGSLTATGDSGGSGIGGGGGYSSTNSQGTTIINGDNGGNITINGGIVTANGGYAGAGIGGGGYASSCSGSCISGNGGTITINGGTVTATGGSNGAAGIGGGYGGDGGNGGIITINGGSVTATSSGTGAAIGGGYGDINSGNGGIITVNGGSVTATTNYGLLGIGGNGGSIIITGGTVMATCNGVNLNHCTGIGGYSSSSNVGSLTMNANNGGAMVFASSVSDMNESRKTGGILVIGNTTYWYGGNNFSLSQDVTVPSGYALKVDESRILTIPVGKTLINNGGVANCGGSIIVNGNWQGNSHFVCSANINLSDSNPFPFGKGWTYLNSVYTVLNGAGVIVSGTSASQRRIEIAENATASVTLSDASIIGLTTNQSPLLLNNGANLTLTLTGTNMLTAGSNYAGIQVPEGTTLAIGGTGNLVATGGGNYGAGIGGGGSGAGGTITITGGAVTATGGINAQGIGRGSGTANAAGTFSMSGNAVVFANSVGDMEESRKTGGILVIGNTTHWYGGNLTLPQNVTVPSGYTLTVPNGKTLTIPNGGTLTNNGTVRPENGSAILVLGTVSGNKIVGANANAPTEESRTTNSVTLNAPSLLAATGQSIEYARNTISSAPASGWQADRTFNGLSANTNYHFFARSSTDANFATGAASGSVQIRTLSVENITFNPATLTFTYNGAARTPAATATSGRIPALQYKAQGEDDNAYTSDAPVNAGNYVARGILPASETHEAKTAEANFTINPKSITINANDINYAGKIYDGNTEVSGLTITPSVASGIVGDDEVTADYAAATFNNKDFGLRTVTVSGITLGGANGSNYNLSNATASKGSITITPKPIAIHASDIVYAGKTYDGNTSVSGLTIMPTENSGIVGSDIVTANYIIALFNDKNAGQSTVNISGITFGGTNAGNYNVATIASKSDVTIIPRQISVHPNDIIYSGKTYDGNTNVTDLVIVPTAANSGIISGDFVTVSYTGAEFNNKDAGQRTVTISGIVFEGIDGGNYNVVSTASKNGVVITQKSIEPEMFSIASQTFTGNELEPEITATFNGNPVTFSTGLYSNNIKVGKATVTITGIGNYTGQITVGFNINKATPPYTLPTNLTATYGQTLVGVELPEGWEWKNPTDLVGDVGERLHKAIFTPEDTENYSIVEVYLTITVNEDSTPIFAGTQGTANNIRLYTAGNNIVLENVPLNTKVEIYNLQGKRIYSANSGNSQILRIAVQAKGVYVVNVGGQTVKVVK